MRVMKHKDKTERVESGTHFAHVHWGLDISCQKLYFSLHSGKIANGETPDGHYPVTIDMSDIQLTNIELYDMLDAVYTAYRFKIPGPVRNLKKKLEEAIDARGKVIEEKNLKERKR